MTNAWYKTQRWQDIRAAQLKREPLCRMCAQEDDVTRATIADHIIPHRGDQQLFWHGELQSLCEDHHNSAKQKIEIHGYDTHTGEDGLPTDPSHPFNRIGQHGRGIRSRKGRPPLSRK